MHITLTACGFEQTIIGFTCGAADGLIYLFEGKWGDAGLSLVSTLPLFIGSAADAGKVARLAAENKARGVGVGVVGIIKAEELVYIPKITEQLAPRGWTKESVKNLISNPFTKRSAKNKANTNSATVFYNKDGAYVSVDDVTKEVIQISDNFDKNWFPDSSIINPYRP